MLLLSAMVGQNHKITENYKAAVRIKLHLDNNPLLYMDEPKSAYLNTAHKAVSYTHLTLPTKA